jgi:putative ABC transport system substrate-binding protein
MLFSRHTKRREFIAGLGGAAVLPMVGRAQQGDRVRRIGVLMGGDENDPEQKPRLSAFTQALADLGWTDRNLRMDIRWGGGDTNRIRALGQELVSLQPDIILTNGLPATGSVRRETATIPIVFVGVGDPVVSRIVTTPCWCGHEWQHQYLLHSANGTTRSAGSPTCVARGLFIP